MGCLRDFSERFATDGTEGWLVLRFVSNGFGAAREGRALGHVVLALDRLGGDVDARHAPRDRDSKMSPACPFQVAQTSVQLVEVRLDHITCGVRPPVLDLLGRFPACTLVTAERAEGERTGASLPEGCLESLAAIGARPRREAKTIGFE